MIFRAYETFQDFVVRKNISSEDLLVGSFQYAAHIVPAFVFIFLASIYAIAFFSTFFGKRALAGTFDLSSSLAAAGILTFVVAVFSSAIPEFMNLPTFIFALIAFIIGVIALFNSKD